MTTKTFLFSALCLAATTARSHADDEVDVRSFEYVDVVETTDGSVWKGIVVEQTPNVQYKIATADGSLHVIKAAEVAKLTKQKNRDYRGAVAVAAPTGGTGGTSAGTGTGNSVNARYEGGSSLPAPFATSGVRLDAATAIVFPTGDIRMTNTSFGPEVRGGYELLLGNVGLAGGGLVRYTYWRLPSQEDPNDAAWTLETHAYARAALHVSRLALWGGGSLGLDSNYIHIGMLNASKTATGLGVNVEGGAEVAALPNLAVRLGFSYHPGTDTILDGLPQSISYYAVTAGASLRM